MDCHMENSLSIHCPDSFALLRLRRVTPSYLRGFLRTGRGGARRKELDTHVEGRAGTLRKTITDRRTHTVCYIIIVVVRL